MHIHTRVHVHMVVVVVVVVSAQCVCVHMSREHTQDGCYLVRCRRGFCAAA